jgi:glycosyltransferase involved in cell wall biosynthesis
MNKYRIPDKYIFYPAQFWHHKNHSRLIQALDVLREKYHIEIPAVFVGSAWESADHVNNLIKELKMDAQILRLGYLEEREIVAIYKKATALVFASFADYTNIPVLEAMVLGTPVICSNVFSMPEQVGDAGLLFDPFNIEDIAEKIYTILSNASLRTELAAKGFKRAEYLSSENFVSQWKAVIQETRVNRG